MTATFRPVVVASLAGLALLMSGVVSFAQIDAGYLANWNDREVRVSYLPESDQTSMTLALVPGGAEAAPVILVFEARWSGRATDVPPTFLELRTYLHPLTDQRVQRRVDLRFTIEPETGPPLSLSYFGKDWGVFGFVPAGADIPVVRFGIAPGELKALGQGERISGMAMGFPFALETSQVGALRQFSQLVLVGETASP
jgi:hypothetical protein